MRWLMRFRGVGVSGQMARLLAISTLNLSLPSVAVAQEHADAPTVQSIVMERLIARRAAAAKSRANESTGNQQGALNLQRFYRNLFSSKNLGIPVPATLPPNKLEADYLASLDAALKNKPYIWLDDHPLAQGEYPAAVALMGYRVSGGVIQTVGVCSGTLIARYAVLTAAHCVCELGGKVRAFLNTENYRSNAGTPVEVTAVRSRLEDCSRYMAANVEERREMLRAAGDVAEMYLDRDAAKVKISPAVLSLSGILCARHSMTRRSMYAKQEDDEGRSGRRGGDADDPQGTH